MAKKAQSTIPSVLAFEKKLVPSDGQMFAVDWDRGFAYTIDGQGGTGATTFIRKFRLSDLQEVQQLLPYLRPGPFGIETRPWPDRYPA